MQNHPHRGVIWPALISGLRVKCQVQPSRPAFAHRRRTCEPASFRISPRFQITLRCSLARGTRSGPARKIGQLTTGCRGSDPCIPFQALRITATRFAAGPDHLSASIRAQCRIEFLRRIQRDSEPADRSGRRSLGGGRRRSCAAFAQPCTHGAESSRLGCLGLASSCPQLISRLALSPRPASEICCLHHAHRRIHISGRVTHFVFGVLPDWLAWFRVLTCGSTASSRAGVEIEFIVRTVPVAGDRSAKVLSC